MPSPGRAVLVRPLCGPLPRAVPEVDVCMSRVFALVAVVGALLAAAPASTAATASVPPRFTGVMWDREIQDAPRAVQEQQWAVMAKSGVGSVRAIFAWHLAQPDPGRPPSFART